MSSYAVNERIWHFSEGEWWPARIIDADGHALVTAPGTAAIIYYGTGDAAVDVDVNNVNEVLPFELSSEKAVTNNVELQMAIEDAKNDDTAKPLREGTSAIIGQKRARSPVAATTTTTTKGKKESKAFGADLLKQTTSSSSINAIKDHLSAAIEGRQVNEVRRCLIQLGGVRMNFELLKETKVGIVVGTVLEGEAFRPLFALAQALLGDWISKLPMATLDALRDEVGVRNAIHTAVSKR